MHPNDTSPQPSLFIPHGAGPCFFMDWNPPQTWDAMATWMKGVPGSLPATPKAILVVSAHWLAPVFTVTSQPAPGLLFDYYGFPEHTYRLRYPAPGSPSLAARVRTLLGEAGIEHAEDSRRDFDHGMFIPLLVMFPQADIPVVQLSLRHDLDPQAHLAAGRALAALREEGVLILGSGMSFHNMRGYGDPRFGPISEAFDAWLQETVAAPAERREQALARWSEAPQARLCHPPRAEEHLLPLMVAAGASASAGTCVFSDRVLETRLSAFRFD